MTAGLTTRATTPPDRHPGRATAAAPVGRAGLVAGALAAGAVLAVLVAALVAGGGAPGPATPGLPDAGPVVGWGQPVVELLGRVLAVLTVGALVLPAVLVPGAPAAPGTEDDRPLPRASCAALRTASAAAAGWAACQATGLLLLTGSLLGRPLTRLVPADVVAVVTALPAGRTVLAELVLLGAVALGAAAARTVAHGRGLLLLALSAAVLPVATTGHPAAAGDHLLTVVVLAVHVLAASLWVGGLVGVLLHLRGEPVLRAVAVRRLSRLALACVLAVTGTGVAGALLVTDVGLPTLLDSGYGHLLVVKTVAVLALVAAGWAHRRHALPRLAAGSPGAFWRLAVVEAVLMASTLAVAVGLSAAPPPEPSAQTTTGTSDQTSTGTPTDAVADASAETPDPAPGPADEPPAAAPDAPGGEAPAPAAEDMSGHDHGDLSVAVLVDDARFHVGDPVQAGAPVTVYNTGPDPVALRADDGSFDAVVPSRTFITFTAPAAGDHAFGDPGSAGYRDVLRVVPAG